MSEQQTDTGGFGNITHTLATSRAKELLTLLISLSPGKRKRILRRLKKKSRQECASEISKQMESQ